MLASIEVTVSHQLGNLFSQHEAALKQLDEAMHDTAAWWIEFGKSMHGMKQEVLGLSESAIQTSVMLGAAAREATDVRRLQHEASVAAGELVEALVQLTDTAHNELEAINGSAYVVKQHLQMRQISFQPWNTWLIKLLGLVHGADLDGVTEFEDLLSFRVMSSILGLSWIAVRTVLSGFISVAVMLFLVTRAYVIRRWSGTVSSVLVESMSMVSPTQTEDSPIHFRRIQFTTRSRIQELSGSGQRRRISRIPDRLSSRST
ncbi:hypothetical protein CPC08DRAFT_98069 [Agrocybe pediades]|nr:hypothetical protein CPC08DRAFT_98069 [Agrocybe pediades]